MDSELSYFNISWFSEHDGPGKRVVLFLQGCNLNCAWCHSPHSKPDVSPLLYFDSLCGKCGACREVCDHGVHSFADDRHTLRREACAKCGHCVEACPNSSTVQHSGALSLPTRKVSVASLFELIRPHLELLQGAGGITFSGGEPLLQYEALAELAAMCKRHGFHTALETSGIVPLRYIQKVHPFIDTWLFGCRLTTGHTAHAAYLERMTRISLDYLTKDSQKEVIARIPVIPGHTDLNLYLDALSLLLAEYGISKIDVLPFNSEATHYYDASGLPFPPVDNKIDAGDRYRYVVSFFNKNRIPA